MADSIFGVGLDDYAPNSVGFGSSTQGEVDTLLKAMSAGDQTGRDLDGTPTSGASLKVEDLESTLKVLTFNERDIKLWKRVEKLPAYNTVEEYNELNSYGGDGDSFYSEGERPEDDDSSFTRKSQLVKYMGTTRVVTHPMSLVKTSGIGGAVQTAVQHGTMKILRDADQGVALADSNIVPAQYNGFVTQHRQAYQSLTDYYESNVTIDCGGVVVTEDKLEDAALAIIENHGAPGTFMAPPSVHSGIASQFHESKLIQPNSDVKDGQIGFATKTFWSQYGPIELDWDKFLKQRTPKTQSSAPSTSRTNTPIAPVPDGTTPVAVSAGNGKFDTRFATNGAYYLVTAVNKAGESAPVLMSSTDANPAANGAIDLKFTKGAGQPGAKDPTGFRIYRSKPTAALTADTKFYHVLDVSAAELAAGFDGAGAGVVRDKGWRIEDTEIGFLLEFTTDVLSFKQLSPLMKMDLAVDSPAYKFMLLLYGTPILYTPPKMTLLYNIGKNMPTT